MARRDRFQYFDTNIFINCPFDIEFQPLFQALVFSIFACGYRARCALEVQDGGEVRIQKIFRIIEECRLGVHDLSRTQLNDQGLPRFNMPLELGMFLGARHFGQNRQRRKNCLILDTEPFRYQAFISDIAGQDIRAHGGDPATTIGIVRDWLSQLRAELPGRNAIQEHYREFREDLPGLCRAVRIEPQELTFNDLTNVVTQWLNGKPFVSLEVGA